MRTGHFPICQESRHDVFLLDQQAEWLDDWCRKYRVRDYLSGAELRFLEETDPEQQTIVNFSWRAEALVSLVWALGGMQEMPPLSEQFWVLDTDFIAAAMKNPNSFRLSANMRSSQEIEEMEGFLYHQHWRVRDKQLGFNVGEDYSLRPGEIPVDDLNSSVVYERRYGLSWAVGCGDDWDDVPTDT